MGPDFSVILMEILSANKNSIPLLKSLLGYANSDLINALKVEFLAEIMALKIENGIVMCKRKCPICFFPKYALELCKEVLLYL